MRRIHLLALALAATGCGGSGSEVGLRLSGPSAVAVFRGVTTKAAGVRPYIAVASARGDELRLVDLDDEKPVLAPVQFTPLSIPTGARPARVAAASLNDGPDGADALVVVPGGTAEVQLVDTWTTANRVRPGDTVDLATLLPAGSAAEIIAIETMPVVGAPGDPPVPGQARILASLAGGWLASIPVSRGAEGAVVLGSPDLITLGFDVTSIAIAPDRVHLYAASPDPIGGVLGVAELDSRDWTLRAIPARGPTTVVAAFQVEERLAGAVDPDDLDPAPRLRVYAVLDPTACGSDHPVPCGVAVLDPVAGGPLADPSGDMPYLAPIPLPGLPVGIAISDPPANGTAGLGRAKFQLDGVDVLLMAARSGQRYTAALGVVPSTDGAAYWLDLTRWRTPNDISALRPVAVGSPPGVAMTSSTSALGYDRVNDDFLGAFLGVCAPDAIPPQPELPPNSTPPPLPPPTCEWTKEKVNTDDPTQPSRVVTAVRARTWLTPGYTPTENWSVTYQVVLPNLALRRALVGRFLDGRLYAALQVPNGPGKPPLAPDFLEVVRVYDPTLGVHAVATHGEGDLVDVTLDPRSDGTSICRDETNADGTAATDPGDPDFVATVAELLPPDPTSYPGGAVVLAEPFVVPVVPPDSPEPGPYVPSCPALVAGEAPVPATLSIRSSGLLLRGEQMGYAGRPSFDEAYELRYVDEDSLAAACAILPWQDSRTDWTCDAACRDACESLVVSRKARRLYYLADRCPDPDAALANQGFDPCVALGFDDQRGENPSVPAIPDDPAQEGDQSVPPPRRDARFTYPHPVGPAVSFRVAPVPQDAELPDLTIWPGATWSFTTTSGMTPVSRRPISGGASSGAVFPTDVATFDRTTIPGREEEGLRFFVSYGSDLVLLFAPSRSGSDVGVLR